MTVLFFRGQPELEEYIRSSTSPNLTRFLELHEQKFANWHTTEISGDDFLKLWYDRYIKMYETVHNKKLQLCQFPMKSKARASLCRRIAAAITVAYQQHLTIAHTEVEALRTQRSIVTRSKKRMREAIEACGKALCEDSDPSFYVSAEEEDQKDDCEDLRNKVDLLHSPPKSLKTVSKIL
ncbi:hypothetical protein EC973_005380, partial [Apophysomyces ossiformis]